MFSRTRFGVAIAAIAFFGLAAAAEVNAQWTVHMRAMQNPLPLGQCTAIEVVVKDANGMTPVSPNGRQIDWQDFELSFVSAAPDAFTWSNEAHRFLCARAPSASIAHVVAYYPGRHLKAGEFVAGVSVQQAIDVAMEGVPQPQSAGAPASGYGQPPSSAAAAPGQPYIPPPGAAAGAAGVGQPQQAAYPTAPAGAAAGAAAGTGAGSAGAGQPQQAAYPSAPAGAAAGAAGAAVPAGAGAGPAGAGQPQQAAYPTAPAGAVAGGPAQAEPQKGGFFKTLGKHLKAKANEVTTQTTQNLTNSATQVVDATAQTGSNLVAGATAEVTSTAQSKVGGIGTSLVPSSLRSGANADNLDLAVKSGQAVLRMVRFVGSTDVLDASGRDVVRRLADVLKTNPGNYLIQAHVDPVPSPLDPQRLSEQRAAAVKSALIRSGVEEPRLKALGYGVSSPRPEVPPEGGPPTSARIEIWKMQ